MTNEKRKILNGTLRYVFLIIMALFVLVPVLWMVSTAFKTEAETYSPTPIWIPSEISLASFKKFFGIYNFGSMTMNSLVTCLGSMIICTVFSCLAGYGVTRFNFKGKKSFLGFLLVTQMFPSVMLNIINLRLDITHLYYPAKNSFQKGRLKRREIFTELLLYTLTT